MRDECTKVPHCSCEAQKESLQFFNCPIDDQCFLTRVIEVSNNKHSELLTQSGLQTIRVEGREGGARLREWPQKART